MSGQNRWNVGEAERGDSPIYLRTSVRRRCAALGSAQPGRGGRGSCGGKRGKAAVAVAGPTPSRGRGRAELGRAGQSWAAATRAEPQRATAGTAVRRCAGAPRQLHVVRARRTQPSAWAVAAVSPPRLRAGQARHGRGRECMVQLARPRRWPRIVQRQRLLRMGERGCRCCIIGAKMSFAQSRPAEVAAGLRSKARGAGEGGRSQRDEGECAVPCKRLERSHACPPVARPVACVLCSASSRPRLGGGRVESVTLALLPAAAEALGQRRGTGGGVEGGMEQTYAAGGALGSSSTPRAQRRLLNWNAATYACDAATTLLQTRGHGSVLSRAPSSDMLQGWECARSLGQPIPAQPNRR